MVELYSPNGQAKVVPHPSKVEEMKKSGWTETPPKQVKEKETVKHG